MDGDRAEFNDYDYRDYDLYAYSDEDEENAEPRNLNVTSDDEDLLPSAVRNIHFFGFTFNSFLVAKIIARKTFDLLSL